MYPHSQAASGFGTDATYVTSLRRLSRYPNTRERNVLKPLLPPCFLARRATEAPEKAGAERTTRFKVEKERDES